MTAWLNLIKAVPELLALVRWLLEKFKELEIDSDIKTGVQQIHQSFQRKDPDELKKLFSGN